MADLSYAATESVDAAVALLAEARAFVEDV